MNRIIDKIADILGRALNVRFKVRLSPEVMNDDETRLSFIRMVKHLEKLANNEDNVYTQTGIDITTIVDPYWDMVEELVSIMYTEELSRLIWWFIFFNRDNTAGISRVWEDIDGTEHKLDTVEQLYDYVNERFLL